MFQGRFVNLTGIIQFLGILTNGNCPLDVFKTSKLFNERMDGVNSRCKQFNPSAILLGVEL